MRIPAGGTACLIALLGLLCGCGAGPRGSEPLRSQEAVPSASAAGWQSVRLPYVHGQLTAYALLPPTHTGACAVPSTAALAQLLRPDSRTATAVTMPQFHLTQTKQLLGVLTREGLQPGGNYAGLDQA